MIGISVLAFFLIVLNIVFWFVFLRKFKKLFSTDDILYSTRAEVTRMIEDINRITARDIDLIESKLKQLKAAAADADRHISVAKSELDKKAKSWELQKTISQASIIAGNTNSRPSQTPRTESLTDSMRAQDVYSITHEGKLALHEQQGTLDFEEEEEHPLVSKTGTKFMIDDQGSTVASIPKLGLNVTYTDNPVKPKKSSSQKVKELYEKGYSVDEIAKELSMTVTEVQFAIDMDF